MKDDFVVQKVNNQQIIKSKKEVRCIMIVCHYAPDVLKNKPLHFCRLQYHSRLFLAKGSSCSYKIFL